MPAGADGHLYQELASIQEKSCDLALTPCSSLGTSETELRPLTVPREAVPTRIGGCPLNSAEEPGKHKGNTANDSFIGGNN